MLILNMDFVQHFLIPFYSIYLAVFYKFQFNDIKYRQFVFNNYQFLTNINYLFTYQ
jgi:hypothetical protein